MGRLKTNQGVLKISRASPECGFLAKDDAKIFALNTGKLQLRAGDKILLGPDREEYRDTLAPPFETGYLFSNVEEPRIKFQFNSTDNYTLMYVDYFQDQNLPVNGDLINNFVITPIEIKELNLNFKKSISNPIHLELEGATFASTSLRHMIITSSDITIPVSIIKGQPVHVRTSPVNQKCSQEFVDGQDTMHEIVGPDATTFNKPYKCVNLFSANYSAHFQVNLSEFTGMTDIDDFLTIEDSNPEHRLEIFNVGASEFMGKMLEFSGTHLAVIYDSPRKLTPSKNPFKLTVQSKTSGGLIEKPGPLTITNNDNRVRFSLQPNHGEYAAIQVSDKVKLSNTNVTVSKEGKVVAMFSNSRLPPIVALDEPNVAMAIEISGEKLSSLNNLISFESLKQSCHRIADISGGVISINGAKGSCYWTLGSQREVNVKVDYNDLQNGCLTIQSLVSDKPIFDRCNIGPAEVLPNFMLRQAYFNVTLKSNSSRFAASLTASTSRAISKMTPADVIEIWSPGYPVSYPWSSLDQVYTVNATGKAYIMSTVDVDIRSGEKLLVGDQEINAANKIVVGDVDISRKLTNVTINRAGTSGDFAIHKGFKLVATRFDQIIVADNANITTPKNISSVYVKISAQSKDAKQFGKRVAFNITSSSKTSQDYELNVIDARTMLGLPIVGDEKGYRGSTTSDTLLVIYRAKKSGAILPELRINHTTINCDAKLDHLCDSATRCVPNNKLCKGIQYCVDGSDIRLPCSAGPSPKPPTIETGMGGVSVFILCVLMLTLGAVGALYGPDLIRNLEGRFRSSHYTTFASAE